MKVPEANLFFKPKKMSFEAASGIGLVFTTAWQMLVPKAQVKSGQLVLIHGAGSGVSSAGIQIARALGAEVIATSTSDAKLEKAKALGARHTINTQSEDFSAKVRSISKTGVDVVFDHIGKDFWEKNVKLVKNGGVLVTCGATSGFEAVTDLRHVFYRQVQILGSTMGSKRDFPKILSYFDKGDFQSVVDKTFALSAAKQAHEYLEKSQQFGKVLLSPELT